MRNILVFDTDKEETEHLKKNIELLRKRYDPNRVTFNEDIHATALGYEAWCRHDFATGKAGVQA